LEDGLDAVDGEIKRAPNAYTPWKAAVAELQSHRWRQAALRDPSRPGGRRRRVTGNQYAVIL
jgi:hypothetical protein